MGGGIIILKPGQDGVTGGFAEGWGGCVIVLRLFKSVSVTGKLPSALSMGEQGSSLGQTAAGMAIPGDTAGHGKPKDLHGQHQEPVSLVLQNKVPSCKHIKVF